MKYTWRLPVIFLAHLSEAQVSYCDRILSIRPSVWRPFTFSNIFSSETISPISTKFGHKYQCKGGTNYYQNFLNGVIPLVAMATRYQIFKKSSSLNPVNGFENFLCRNIPQLIVYQSCSKNLIPLKNMAARRGHFPYMFYVEKLKKFFFSETIGQIWWTFASNTYLVTRHKYCWNQVDI